MATFLVMAVPFATSLLAAGPFVLIMGIPFATLLLASIHFAALLINTVVSPRADLKVINS